MSAPPFLPSEICALRVGANSSPCERRDSAALLADKVCALAKWMMNDDGTVNPGYAEWVGTGGGGTSGGTTLAAPTGVSATSDRSSDVQISWNSVAAATSYSIFRGTSSGSLSLLVSGRSASPYQDTTAEVDVVYFYAVMASNALLNSVQSSPVTGKKVAAGVGVLPGELYSDLAAREITTPAGAVSMVAELWGPGGPGGKNNTQIFTYPNRPAYGGGGASGGYIKITGIPVVGGTTKFVLLPGASGGDTILYRDSLGSASRVKANGGGQGGNASFTSPGIGGVKAPSAGVNSLPVGVTDTLTLGEDGGDGSIDGGAGGGVGGAAVEGGQGAGGTGGQGTTNPPGENGMIRLTFA
jgi:hypothetical protein